MNKVEIVIAACCVVIASVSCVCANGCGARGSGLGIEKGIPPSPNRVDNEIERVVSASMDMSIDPCVDFYQYACGGWMKATTPPSGSGNWSRGFSEVVKRNNEYLSSFITSVDKETGTDVRMTKLKNYYDSCMNGTAIENAGGSPLVSVLKPIDEITNLEDFFENVGRLQTYGIPVLISQTVYPTATAPKTNALQLSQGGLGMPGKDFYLDRTYHKIQVEYSKYIQSMLLLLGDPPEDAQKRAEAIYYFEKQLATHSKPITELGTAAEAPKSMTVHQLTDITQGLPWLSLLRAQGLDAEVPISVQSIDYFIALETILRKETSMDTLRHYLRWQTATTLASYLSSDFANTRFEFYGKAFSGLDNPPARATQCIENVKSDLPNLLTEAYLSQQYAPDVTGTLITKMIQNIRTAFITNLDHLDWITDEGRRWAKAKANKMAIQVGGPSVLYMYEDLNFSPDTWFENYTRVVNKEFSRLVEKIGEPLKRDHWYITAYTANAYYNPQTNNIAVPAGILQFPFYDTDYPVSMVYGAIGMIAGHEFTHGFDSNGTYYDNEGNFVGKSLLDTKSAEQFKERSICIEKMYDSYTLPSGNHVNGQNTLAENIADQGGVRLAYKALSNHLRENPTDGQSISGLTNEQLFFVAFAQSWCSVSTPQYLETMIRTDPHAPAQFRVNGAVQYMQEFKDAFSCEQVKTSLKIEQCNIW